MSATKSIRAKSLRLDSDRNGTFAELFESDITALRAGPRVWGPFEIDMGTVGETVVLEVPAGKQLILTAVLVWQDNKGTVQSYGTIQVTNEGDSITGPIYVEADSHQTFRFAVTGRSIEANGEIRIGVVIEEQGVGSLDAQIYLEGYLI